MVLLRILGAAIGRYELIIISSAKLGEVGKPLLEVDIGKSDFVRVNKCILQREICRTKTLFISLTRYPLSPFPKWHDIPKTERQSTAEA